MGNQQSKKLEDIPSEIYADILFKNSEESHSTTLMFERKNNEYYYWTNDRNIFYKSNDKLKQGDKFLLDDKMWKVIHILYKPFN